MQPFRFCFQRPTVGMSRRRLQVVLCTAALGAISLAVQAQLPPPGATVDSLLAVARENNPEVAGMRYEAAASAERVEPAAALPDPRFRTELRDITRMGTQNPTLLPGRVGSTRYLLMQDVPWQGKRELRREVAELEAQGARGRAMLAWTDVAARIKTTYAQLYYLKRSERLTREIIDLMARLEKIVQSRYAGGLAAQQDVIRAQVEQTGMRSELIALEAERHHLHTRMNALLARPAGAALSEPESLRPIPPAATLDYTTLAERVRTRNPLVSSEEFRVRAAEKSRDLTTRNRYPDFTFGISPIQYGSAFKEWELMVEINIPWLQSSRGAQEREAEAMLSAARSRQEAAMNQVLSELSENLASLDAARKTEALATDRLLPQSELTFQAALAGYENGKVDFATLLDAQRQIRQARQNQVKAQAEAQARLADIERLVGEDL